MIALQELNKLHPVNGKFLTLAQQLKRQQIAAHVRQKWEKFDRLETVKQLPPLEYFGSNPVWLGAWSRTSTAMHEKFILENVGIRVDDAAPPLATPSDIARGWVDTTVSKRLKAHRNQLDFWNAYHHVSPAYARNGVYRDMVYMDLKSAYWSIMQVVGWGAEYWPNRIVRRYPLDSFPYPDNKLARNCLATIGLGSPARMWHDGEFKTVGGQRVTNRSIFYLCVDILQAIAIDMIEFSPVYINTDGYIIPAQYEDAAIRKIDERWGLHLARKHKGNCIVYGIGSYAIGGHKTQRLTQMNHGGGGVNYNVPHAMLQYWFRFLSDLFPPKY